MNTKMVVLTNPVAGGEDEYNRWYSEEHLRDVLRIPGFVAAQRFRLSETQRSTDELPWRYMAIYEIAPGKTEMALGELARRSGTPDLAVSDSMDRNLKVWVYEPITDHIEADSDVDIKMA